MSAIFKQLNDPEGFLLARSKVRAKDIKKQRWAGIVAAVLALGMLVSLVGVYIGQSFGGSRASLPEQQVEPQPEDYLAHYESEVERLELYLDEHEASEAVLLELVENYRYLTYIQQIFFDDQESLVGYKERLVAHYKTLIEMEPGKVQYRLDLLNLYIEQGVDQDLIYEQVVPLQEMLREAPDPMAHLTLISLLSSTGEVEPAQEEAQWLFTYLEDRIASGQADSEERFYFAVLLGEYLDDRAQAITILDGIIAVENEESAVYLEAFNYLNYIQSDTDDGELAPE
jgi:hypothetical protein